MPRRHRVPVCLMGLTNLSYGLYGGVVAFAVPQLLGDRRVPEAIAELVNPAGRVASCVETRDPS